MPSTARRSSRQAYATPSRTLRRASTSGAKMRARAGLPWADGVVAAGIAVFIAFLGVQVLIGSFNTLTDRAVLASEGLAAIVTAVPGVRACRDIRTRGGLGAVYVDLVVHVDGDMSLSAAHDVADRIEAVLQHAHPEIVDVVVHLEPA